MIKIPKLEKFRDCKALETVKKVIIPLWIVLSFPCKFGNNGKFIHMTFKIILLRPRSFKLRHTTKLDANMSISIHEISKY